LCSRAKGRSRDRDSRVEWTKKPKLFSFKLHIYYIQLFVSIFYRELARARGLVRRLIKSLVGAQSVGAGAQVSLPPTLLLNKIRRMGKQSFWFHSDALHRVLDYSLANWFSLTEQTVAWLTIDKSWTRGIIPSTASSIDLFRARSRGRGRVVEGLWDRTFSASCSHINKNRGHFVLLIKEQLELSSQSHHQELDVELEWPKTNRNKFSDFS
jgi:hypothetical protein